MIGSQSGRTLNITQCALCTFIICQIEKKSISVLKKKKIQLRLLHCGTSHMKSNALPFDRALQTF